MKLCLFQKSNIGDLQLRTWKKRRHQDYKTSRYGKTKTYFNKPSNWLKRMTVRDQENVFLSLIWTYRTGGIKMFILDNSCRCSLPTWRKVIPLYSFLLQSKVFLMHIMWNILAKHCILKSFRNTESFLSF